MTDIQNTCFWLDVMLNVFTAAGFITTVWFIVTYEELRKHIMQAVQNADNITHWSDGKNVVSLLLGLFVLWFTLNLLIVFVGFSLIDAEHIAILVMLFTVSFALLQIAWKKP